MNADKHTAAMDALNELILSELQSGDRQRFASVKRLSVIAQKLLLENNPSAEDADPDGDEDIGDDFVMAAPRRRRRGGAMLAIPGTDSQAQLREMLAMLTPVFADLKKQTEARRKESLARELNQLILASRGVHRVQIQARIDTILAELNEETREGDQDGLSLVPTVDVRGHQAGTGVGGFDQAGHYRPFADGEGRDSRAIEEGREARRVPGAVGHTGVVVVVTEPGLDQGAIGHVGGPDLQGAGGAPKEPEAAPEAGVGGALHEREGRAGDGGDASDDRRWYRVTDNGGIIDERNLQPRIPGDNYWDDLREEA